MTDATEAPTEGMMIGYARVSTEELKELRKASRLARKHSPKK